MKLYALGVAAALSIGVIATGCGSSDDNGDSTSSLSKTEWIAKADSICHQGDQQIEQQARQTFGNERPTAAQVQQFAADTALPNTQSEIDKIRALGAPSGEEDQVNKILDTVQADIDEVKSKGDYSNATFADANTLAKQYGLKVCGQD